jgi:hypothetical protein
MGASSSRGFSPPSRRANAVPSRPSPRERAARKVAEQAEVKRLAAKVKEAAILDMMVGGKQLRFHTGAEVALLDERASSTRRARPR